MTFFRSRENVFLGFFLNHMTYWEIRDECELKKSP